MRSSLVLTFNFGFNIFRADDQNEAAQQDNNLDGSIGILKPGQVSRDSDRGLSFSMLVGIRLLHACISSAKSKANTNGFLVT